MREPEAIVNNLLPVLREMCAGAYGIALGGSCAKGTSDALSDVDVYLFADAVLPGERRRALVERHAGPDARVETWGADEPFTQGGTDFEYEGVRVECWLRSAPQVERTIAESARGEIRRDLAVWAVMGFVSYGVMADVHSMRIVDDPRGMLARWKAAVDPYPPPLRDAILRRFGAEAGFWPRNPHYLGAVERADVIYTSGIVQQTVHALIQVVFALNRAYFPGEKKLAQAMEKLPLQPPSFAARLEALLCPGLRPDVAQLREQQRALAALVDEAATLVSAAG